MHQFLIRNYAAEDFPLAVNSEAGGNGDQAEHIHDFYEIMFVTRGCGICSLDDVNYPMIGGDLFLIGDRDRHSFSPGEGFRYCNVIFRPEIFSAFELANLEQLSVCRDWLERRPGRLRKLSMSPGSFREMRQLFNRLETVLRSRGPARLLAAKSLFMMFIVDLFQYLERGRAPEARGGERVVARVTGYIRENIRRPITLAELAAAGRIGVTQLCAAFRKTLGVTPGEYITRIRIEQARFLLEDAELSVSEIAYGTGFSDPGYFARCFRRHVQMSPREYRNARK